MKPASMTKISITGHDKHLEKTIDVLYDLKLLDIDTYGGELETGNPFEEAEELSEVLVGVRSILSKLPESEEGGNTFDSSNTREIVNRTRKQTEEIADREAEVIEEKKSIKRQIEFLKKLEGCDLKIEDLEGTENLSVAIGKPESEDAIQNCEEELYEAYRGKNAIVVVYRNNSDAGRAVSSGSFQEIKKPAIEFEGNVSEALEKSKERKEELERQHSEIRAKLQKISDKKRSKLEEIEHYLEERVEKAEAPLNFATTDETFIIEGWIPSDKFRELGTSLYSETDGRVHLQEEEAEKEPPTKHENSNPAKPFESLTDLVSVPRHNEIDPSTVLMLSFPLFFGFMIGDAGYGLTTLAVFYGGYKLFPEAEKIFKSLMYASVATVAFGLAFGDAFGFVIFGHHSELAAATGLHIFEKIPILFHRAEHLGTVFNAAAAIGFVHVNLGYIIGFYNEYSKHGLKEAFLEKVSWLLLEIGALGWFAFGPKVGVPVLAISVVMLYVGEGVEGIVEIPSLLSNVLSYLRIFGVSVAAVALAAVVNAMAEPLYAMGGLIGFTLGTLVLIIGHIFNTFIKIMEGFLQGIRLHYVEMFDKFYEGGGRKYAPFGK